MPIALYWGSATHQGRIRPANQDALLAGPDVFAVADGMGGYSRGEVASGMAIAALSRLGGLRSHPDPATTVHETLIATNRAIRERSRHSGTAAMGTTAAGIAWAGGADLVVFNVGDSRVYRLRGGRFEQLTDDHSVVADLIRAGEISLAEAETHPHRNVVTRSLGVEATVEIDMAWEQAATGDLYLIATDGLFKEVRSAAIASIAQGEGSAAVRARRLIDAALGNGGRDNVSAVLVEVVAQEGLIGALDHDTAPARGRPVGTPT